MPKIMLEGYECGRCGHQWVPRSKIDEPTICPKCKSPYWNKPRLKDIKLENQKLTSQKLRENKIGR